jgi:3-deoxy-D-manno-octulosonate 8-phosphate phosphatase (KDO 8-P phosphatase)
MAKKSAAAIRLLVLDVDGVLTDGRLHFGPKGEALKLFHVRDGLGIQQVAQAGIEVAVISGRKSKMVDVRCRELGVEHVFQGAKDKVAVLQKLCARLKIEPAECACIGDDLPDIPVMRKVALAFAVADAHTEARHAAHLITRLPGGYGAVREVCDYLLAHRPKARAS